MRIKKLKLPGELLYTLCLYLCLFSKFPISEIIQYVMFYDWFLSLSTMLFWFGLDQGFTTLPSLTPELLIFLP
jgi:hypothetical protein